MLNFLSILNFDKLKNKTKTWLITVSNNMTLSDATVNLKQFLPK